MKIILTDGREVAVDWAHIRLDSFRSCSQDYEVMQPDPHMRGYTLCFLQFADGTQAVGKATCIMADNYDKARGRKISLVRALSNSLLCREDRQLVWQFLLRAGVRL